MDRLTDGTLHDNTLWPEWAGGKNIHICDFKCVNFKYKLAFAI